MCTKGGLEHGVLYSNHGHNRIECFMDVDWTGSKEERRFLAEGNLVSWKSKNKNMVSYSSAEYE